jgi:hypothetical protein
MVISKKDTQQTYRAEVEETTLTQVKSFQYLETAITADGKSNTKDKSRIDKPKQLFTK